MGQISSPGIALVSLSPQGDTSSHEKVIYYNIQIEIIILFSLHAVGCMYGSVHVLVPSVCVFIIYFNTF